MRATLFFLTFTFSIATIFAQDISYSSSNLGEIGDSYHTLKMQYDSASWVPADEIDPQLWDFSAIVPATSDLVEIKSKNDFAGLEDLPETTMVMENDDSSYLCVNLNGDVLELLGIIARINEEYVPIILPEPQEMLHFPLNVGEGGQETMSYSIAGEPEDFNQSIPFTDSIRLEITMTASSMVEAIGYVNTFQNDFPAFKIVNTSIMQADLYAKPTIGGWYLMMEDVVNDSTKSLQFYTPQYGIPVVQVNLTWDDKIKNYQTIDDDLQSITQKTNNALVCYPNPNTPNGILRFNNHLSSIKIFDINGRLIYQAPTATRQIQLPGLNSGVYMVKTGKENSFFKLIIGD